ncbi:hypothetical protein, partial [Pseudomonas sp. MH10]|uniref:hypothetical protein n=1 Tax=Pseudomonas sp. MH10 TaxID=3048627 RepID=UPI002B23C00F
MDLICGLRAVFRLWALMCHRDQFLKVTLQFVYAVQINYKTSRQHLPDANAKMLLIGDFLDHIGFFSATFGSVIYEF